MTASWPAAEMGLQKTMRQAAMAAEFAELAELKIQPMDRWTREEIELFRAEYEGYSCFGTGGGIVIPDDHMLLSNIELKRPAPSPVLAGCVNRQQRRAAARAQAKGRR